MNRSPRPTLVAALLTAFAALVASRAAAQTAASDTLAAARELHDEAIQALDRGDYASACPKLERVVELIPQGVGARLSLADCYAGAGKLASAWRVYVVVEEAAAKGGQHNRQLAARKKAEELRPKLARIKIIVPDGVRALPGMTVLRDAAPLEQALWGLEVPVDKGKHSIAVTALGKQRWEKTVTLDDGDVVSVKVEAPPDEAPSEPAPPPPAPAPSIHAAQASWSPQQVGGVMAVGLGVASMGVGAFFGLTAISKNKASNADGHCHDRNACDDVGYQRRQEAYRAGNISTALFAAGGAALAAGIALYFTAPRRASVELSLGPGGVTMQERW